MRLKSFPFAFHLIWSSLLNILGFCQQVAIYLLFSEKMLSFSPALSPPLFFISLFFIVFHLFLCLIRFMAPSVEAETLNPKRGTVCFQSYSKCVFTERSCKDELSFSTVETKFLSHARWQWWKIEKSGKLFARKRLAGRQVSSCDSYLQGNQINPAMRHDSLHRRH